MAISKSHTGPYFISSLNQLEIDTHPDNANRIVDIPKQDLNKLISQYPQFNIVLLEYEDTIDDVNDTLSEFIKEHHVYIDESMIEQWNEVGNDFSVPNKSTYLIRLPVDNN